MQGKGAMRAILRFGRGIQAWTKALAGAALLVVQAPGPAQAETAPPTARIAAPRPAIWLLEDSDTKIYLFGTTHLFERGLAWRSPRLDLIIREADELVTETGGDEENLDLDEIGRAMFMSKSVPILSRVSETHRPQLQRIVDASGMSVEMWDTLHSWAAAVTVMSVQAMEGLTPEQREQGNPLGMMSGAEAELGTEFRRSNRPISGVETSIFQLDLLRTLPRPAQQAFLEMALDEAARAQEAAATGVDAAWVSGNVEAIAREMEVMPPVLYERLLTVRNRDWTEWLARRLERPGTVLFAVGAGHLAGRDSVQSMLAARGLSARRID
jgi:uncharacterized protein